MSESMEHARPDQPAPGKDDHGSSRSLFAACYAELRVIAEREMRRERADHTLQPTALVHEAFARLSGERRIDWNDRAHFLAEAAIAMRRVLVDHARAVNAAKRPGATRRVILDDKTPALIEPGDPFVIDLDDALNDLAALDERQARTVTLRYFGGCTKEETAMVLGVSTSTVANDWNAARAWLRARFASHADSEGK